MITIKLEDVIIDIKNNGIWTNIKIYYLYSGFNLYDNTDSKEKGNNQRQEY